MSCLLTKWYVDVVTADGRTAIAYWSDLRLGALHASVAGLLHGTDALAERVFTLRAGSGPRPTDDRLAWHTPALDLHVDVARGAPAIHHRLLDTPDGSVTWTVWSPAAAVHITAHGDRWTGTGYAERLDLTLAPWAVPVDTFQWGRWIGGGHTLVWIVWVGPVPRQLAWLDGVPVSLDAATPHGVELGGARRLTLTDHVVLTDSGISAPLATLTPLRALTDRFARSHQTRWRSTGRLDRPGAPGVSGWAIHEVVRWR